MSDFAEVPDTPGLDEVQFLPRVPARDLTGSEPIRGSNSKTVVDYWRWAHSDILENVQRGIFAEYIVADALGIAGAQRIGWAGYDLEYKGKKIEVKSSAYLQSWNQRTLSRPTFSIGARQQWIEGSGKYADARYVADCFVFCLYEDADGPTADILNLSGWSFYVVAISELVRSCKAAKRVSLERLEQIAERNSFGGLKEAVDSALRRQDLETDQPRSVEPAAPPNGGPTPTKNAVRTYLVAERKTRRHPVIVNASNYKEAQLLARANSTIASFGTNVSAFELSAAKAGQALEAGAIDLRSQVD